MCVCGWTDLCRPEVELFERGELDELLSTGTGDVGEGQTQVLQVPKGTGAKQPGQVSVLGGFVGEGGGGAGGRVTSCTASISVVLGFDGSATG